MLLSLLEREAAPSEEAIGRVVALLDSDNPLIVHRSYRYLALQKLSRSWQEKFRALEQQHPDR
ncbi:MAG: hypothetical protein ACYC6Y_16765 [Thermoguttaceae bacterium]